jgi:hypothetical protein
LKSSYGGTLGVPKLMEKSQEWVASASLLMRKEG